MEVDGGGEGGGGGEDGGQGANSEEQMALHRFMVQSLTSFVRRYHKVLAQLEARIQDEVLGSPDLPEWLKEAIETHLYL
jgi:hypothetical protein